MDEFYSGTDIPLLLENARRYRHIYTRKEEDLYVREHLELMDHPERIQHFYEYFTSLDSWLVYDEALAISVCADPLWWPQVMREIYHKWYMEVGDRIDSSVNVTLKLVNPDADKDDWRVRPKDFVKWLIEKNLPPRPELIEMLGLGSFVDVPKDKLSSHGNATRHARNRENVLSAAISVISAVPEKCKRGGQFKQSLIVDQIELFRNYLFENGQIPLSQRKMRELVGNALKKIPEK